MGFLAKIFGQAVVGQFLKFLQGIIKDWLDGMAREELGRQKAINEASAKTAAKKRFVEAKAAQEPDPGTVAGRLDEGTF